MKKEIKNIAYFVGEFPKISNSFIASQIIEIKRRGISVVIYSLNEPSNQSVFQKEHYLECPVFYIKKETTFGRAVMAHIIFLFSKLSIYESILVDVFARKINWKIFLKYLWIAINIKKQNPDHIHCYFAEGQTVIAMLSSRLTGIPFSFHNGGTGNLLFRKRSFEPVIKHCQVCFAVSSELKDNIDKNFFFSNKKTIVNTTGIDIKKFHSKGIRSYPKNKIIFVGRQVKHKGIADLIQCVANLKSQGLDVHCTIVGEGQDREEFKSQANNLNLEKEITFTGAVHNNDLSHYYHHTSVFVFPSYLEGSPVSIMEAMASGLPIISTKISGIPDMVRDGYNGYLVEAGDISSLGEKVKLLLGNPQEIKRMGRNSIEKSKEYSIQGAVDAIIKQWKDVDS